MIGEQKYAITIGNKIYKYTKGALLKNLKEINVCPFNQCKYEYNNDTVIEDIEDDTILIKNAYKIKMEQDCDNREIVLEGNALINLYNCKIEIKNKSFKNQKVIVEERYIFPETDVLQFEKVIHFSEIIINQKKILTNWKN